MSEININVSKIDMDLDQVDNTSDVNKPISTAQQTALDLKVDKVAGSRLITSAESTVIGNTSGTNTGDNATNTTSNTYADGKVTDAISDGVTTIAPSQNAVFDALALKANIASPTFTGTPLAPTATLGTNTTQIATTAFVIANAPITDLSSLMVKTANLSDVASKFTSRSNLNLEKITNGGNAVYSILNTDKIVLTGTVLTASRTWTLPDASTVNAGQEIIVSDFIQTVTSVNTIVIACQSGQKINNTTNGTEIIKNAGGFRRFISDGVSNWSCDLGIVRLSDAQTLTNKTISLTSNTITGTQTEFNTALTTYDFVVRIPNNTRANIISQTPPAGTYAFATDDKKDWQYNGTTWQIPGETIELTNTAGVTLVEGDVVQVESATDNAVDRSNFANDINTFGIVCYSAVDNAQVTIATAGIWKVNITGAVTRSHYINQSSTIATAVSVGSLATKGSFAIALKTDATATAKLVPCLICLNTESV